MDHAAVIRNLTGVHAVIQHTNGEEHRAGYETVRDHLNNTALYAQGAEEEEAQSNKAHVGH